MTPDVNDMRKSLLPNGAAAAQWGVLLPPGDLQAGWSAVQAGRGVLVYGVCSLGGPGGRGGARGDSPTASLQRAR